MTPIKRDEEREEETAGERVDRPDPGETKDDIDLEDRVDRFDELEDEQRLLTTLKLTLRQREIDFQVPKKTIEILNTAEAARFASKPNWALNILFAFAFGREQSELEFRVEILGDVLRVVAGFVNHLRAVFDDGHGVIFFLC